MPYAGEACTWSAAVPGGESCASMEALSAPVARDFYANLGDNASRARKFAQRGGKFANLRKDEIGAARAINLGFGAAGDHHRQKRRLPRVSDSAIIQYQCQVVSGIADIQARAGFQPFC